MALTDLQNEFLKEQLKNNPEFIARYFPNIITEGPSGPLYDVNPFMGDRPSNVYWDRGAEFRDVNVPYDTEGSRINIRDIPLDPSEPDEFPIAGIDAEEQFYEDKPTAGGQTQAINMNPDILASYGTGEWSPSSGKVTTPEWFKKIGKLFGFETDPTTDQGILNDTIEHILAHETGHGVSGLKFYKPDTEKATTSSFSEFLTPNIKQGKKSREAHDLSKLDFDEREGYAFIQEELFNRMKDIERLKRKHPDSYEDHPLWDLYYNRAQQKFAELTGLDWYKGRKLSKFKDYEEKIKPSVDKYFERVEKKGKGMSDINIEKEEIRMPENLTRVETPYVSPRGGGADVMPIGTAGRNPWGRAHGGLMDIPLPGRSRYI